MENSDNPSVPGLTRVCTLGIYETLLANLPAWIFGVDERCNIIWSNNFSSQVIGYDPLELRSPKNWSLLNLVSPGARSELLQKVEGVFSQKGSKFFSLDTTLFHKERFCVYVGLRAFLLLKQDSHSSILFFLAVNETDKVVLERLGSNEERLVTLGTMAAEIAHEIKNSLISIGALAHSLKKIAGEKEKKGLELIEKEVIRLEKLARSVNALARPSKGDKTKQDVVSILQKSLCLLSPEIKKKNIKISLDLHENTKQTVVNNDMLMVVFVNLIRNAMNALPSKGMLWIKSRMDEKGMSLEFRNEMVKRKVERQRDLFRPLDKGGTSIGLPFSYKIVENMGGRLSFEQQGNHAVFNIFFPKKAMSCLT